jgi:glycosyltransferase involved in cell wall biosynthesis
MKKPSRILILSGVFLADIAGPPILLKALIKELISQGYQVNVLTFGQKSEARKYPYSVKVVSGQWPFFLKSLIYLIKGMILACQADILYNQDLYTAGLTSLIIKKILRKKLVTRFVGDSAWETALNKKETTDDILTFQQKKYSASTERRKRIRKKILLNSDKIIVVSHFLRDLAQGIGVKRAKIKVIYNSIGFLEDKAKNISREELKKELGLSGRIMLTNARLTPWKGIDMLIEIMPDLLKRYSQLKFMVIGQGPEQANLEKLIRNLNLENQVFLLGRVSRQEVIDYLRASDLFVLNSNYEDRHFHYSH